MRPGRSCRTPTVGNEPSRERPGELDLEGELLRERHGEILREDRDVHVTVRALLAAGSGSEEQCQPDARAGSQDGAEAFLEEGIDRHAEQDTKGGRLP